MTGWTDRYTKAQTDDVPDMDRIARWLSDHLPAESGAAVIHNDYKYDNLVLEADDPTRIVAVLDWEMATVGDPLMDLGTTWATGSRRATRTLCGGPPLVPRPCPAA